MTNTVLVVEEEEGAREVLAAMLRDFGYTVETAENGQVAMTRIAAYEKPHPDVVLLEMRMPVMGGAQVLRALAKSGRLASLHVVVMSGHAREAQGLGAKRLITKPVSVELVLEAVREACGETDQRTT